MNEQILKDQIKLLEIQVQWLRNEVRQLQNDVLTLNDKLNLANTSKEEETRPCDSGLEKIPWGDLQASLTKIQTLLEERLGVPADRATGQARPSDDVTFRDLQRAGAEVAPDELPRTSRLAGYAAVSRQVDTYPAGGRFSVYAENEQSQIKQGDKGTEQPLDKKKKSEGGSPFFRLFISE